MNHQVPTSTVAEIAKQDTQFQKFLSTQLVIALANIPENINQQTSSTSKNVSRIVNGISEEKPNREAPNRHEREDACIYNEDQKEAEKRRRNNRIYIDKKVSED